LLLPALSLFAAVVMASSAGAHVQVTPGLVAPADPVLFTVLVPGETESGTAKVELKIPPGVFPFSYEDVPGWQRKVVEKPNGLPDRIVWTGRAAPDGLLRFNFLAGTPAKSTEISWKAIQTYADGKEVAWIGPPESEEPAAVTVVSADAPRQNAGGEGGRPGQGVPAAGVGAEESADDKGHEHDDWIGRGLGLLAVLLAGWALVVILRRR
jgi:uncharacterized protein YcnI